MVLGCLVLSTAQESDLLLKSVPSEGIQRNWDHFGVDLPGNRLFVSSEEEPVIEVFDLKTGKHLHTLTGFKD